MTSHRQMKDLAESRETVRALARQLLALGTAEPPMAWTEWEMDFLESMACRDSRDPLSLRQREVLTELRDAAQRQSKIDGFKVQTLVERCWVEREYLSDDEDRRFVEDLTRLGAQSVTRRQLGRLLRCCREVGVIESHHGFTG